MSFCWIISTVSQNKLFCILGAFWIIKSSDGKVLWGGLRRKFIMNKCNQNIKVHPQSTLEVTLGLDVSRSSYIVISNVRIRVWEQVCKGLPGQPKTYKAKCRDNKTNNYSNLCLHVKGSHKRQWGLCLTCFCLQEGERTPWTCEEQAENHAGTIEGVSSTVCVGLPQESKWVYGLSPP